jgi:hypothetical protein
MMCCEETIDQRVEIQHARQSCVVMSRSEHPKEAAPYRKQQVQHELSLSTVNCVDIYTSFIILFVYQASG